MIDTRIVEAGTFAARFAADAVRLAKARAEATLRERRDDPSRWRHASLLWPLFGKDR